MKPNETAGNFHKRHGREYADAGQFNVYKVEEFAHEITLPPNRRDFYKISLITKGEGVLSYADKVVEVKANAISFANPMIPYSWERISENVEGYFCIFTEDFVTNQLKTESLSDSPLFKIGGNSVLFPCEKSMLFLTGIFDQMLAEMQSSYINKYDLLRSYVQIIIHEALKIQPPENHFKAGNSSKRIAELFLELLERQFPVTSPLHVVPLKNASEFAGRLSIHTNHLNRALKEITGKTTTELIAGG
jgi:AraC family transcriptional activator of pobA